MPFFYKGYNVSRHVQQGHLMAANHHPEYARVLADNKTAFFKKTGMAGIHLDNSKNAVARKSNQCLENSRIV